MFHLYSEWTECGLQKGIPETSLVVPCSHCRGPGFEPWSGELDPTCCRRACVLQLRSGAAK